RAHHFVLSSFPTRRSSDLGWFRTGDLGLIDRDGFLFVTGRTKEVLVLGGGKKVVPEDLERIYGSAPEIAEIAVLEDKGTLVALVDRKSTRLNSSHQIISYA